jgi:hypothetical protein
MKSEKGFTYLEVISGFMCIVVFLGFLLPTAYFAYDMHIKSKDLYEGSYYAQNVLLQAKAFIQKEGVKLEDEEYKIEQIKKFEQYCETEKFTSELEIRWIYDEEEYSNVKILLEPFSTIQLESEDFGDPKAPRTLVIHAGKLNRDEVTIIDSLGSDLLIKFLNAEKPIQYEIEKEAGNYFIEYTNLWRESKKYGITLSIKDKEENIIWKIKDLVIVNKKY